MAPKPKPFRKIETELKELELRVDRLNKKNPAVAVKAKEMIRFVLLTLKDEFGLDYWPEVTGDQNAVSLALRRADGLKELFQVYAKAEVGAKVDLLVSVEPDNARRLALRRELAKATPDATYLEDAKTPIINLGVGADTDELKEFVRDAFVRTIAKSDPPRALVFATTSQSAEKPSSLAQVQQTHPLDWPDDVRNALLEDDLDVPGMTTWRSGQQRIREVLSNGAAECSCVVCQRTLPATLLVAAHIYPRSECSPHQKLDVANLALMCLLGCDALFERGFISVVNGEVEEGPVHTKNQATIDALTTVMHNRLKEHSAAAEAYYARKRALMQERSGSAFLYS